MPAESAIVALIPEAERLVEAFRRQHDPAAAAGVPAHVTILYPFQPPEALTEATLAVLRALFAERPAFTVALTEARRFPEVLYLAPTPAEPFRELTAAVAARFPETPPYGGAFAEVIPHLTVAQPADSAQLDQIAADFAEAARGQLPIRARVEALTLLENSAGHWRVRAVFPLAAAAR